MSGMERRILAHSNLGEILNDWREKGNFSVGETETFTVAQGTI